MCSSSGADSAENVYTAQTGRSGRACSQQSRAGSSLCPAMPACPGRQLCQMAQRTNAHALNAHDCAGIWPWLMS